jgi:polysaccharide export outer membrane protein
MKTAILSLASLLVVGALNAHDLAAQKAPVSPPSKPPAAPAIPEGVKPPEDYLIGSDDILTVVFWREKDMSSDVVVRPDGKITLPLINEIVAAGLTPEQLREKITTAALRYIEDPAATVVVKQINSRKVFITGEVEKQGPYTLTSPTTVLQLIALAGGLKDFAHPKEIVIIRTEGGRQQSFPFDYSAVTRRKNLQQNILLKPGDTVIVP